MANGNPIKMPLIPSAMRLIGRPMCSRSDIPPLAILGDAYISQRRNKDAIKMFKAAISKQFGTGSLQDRSYYEEIPARRLSELFYVENELEQAIWYNKVAMKHASDDKQLLAQRKEIITKLWKTICQ